mmetsp:Transcript_22254/g.10661  ORF Transcript_22254/g.10661 Transcript_22254/m.10661 type:complete len:445 (+) Transcript_22254:314-1648(+)
MFTSTNKLERNNMQVTIEDISTVKKILHIEIPEKEVHNEVEKAYNILKKTASIKGFRKGKVPRLMLERYYKNDVNADVMEKLIKESFTGAVKEAKLNVLGNPQINPGDLKDKEPYKYEATIEIKPKLDNIDFFGLTLKKTKYEVKDKDIEAQLTMLQRKMATYEVIEEDRPVQKDDFVSFDYEGFKDGVIFEETEKTENCTLKVGDSTISKEFDENIIGMKIGEEKEFKVKFTEDYHNEKLAGVEIDFKVSINEIKKEVLSEINDEFAKKVGKDITLDELKKKIRDNLQEGYDKRAEQEINEQIFTALLEKTDFEVPDVLVKYELDSIIDEVEKTFSYYNKSLEKADLTKEKLAEKYRGTAEKQVRRYIILNQIIEQEKYELSDEDIKGGFDVISKNLDQLAEEIKKYYDNNKVEFEYFKQTLLEKKAIELIINNSIIEEVEPE